MGWTSIILREATTNLMRNPSFEEGTTRTTIVNGATRGRNSDESKWGGYSLRVTPSAVNANSGFYQYSAVGQATNTAHTYSVWVNGDSGVSYRIQLTDSTPTTLATQNFTGTGEWQYVEVTGTSLAVTQLRCHVHKIAAGGNDFYVDGMQLEAKSYSTTYVDGDQPGCEWNGTYHNSTSARSAVTRHGGRVIDLSDYGLCIDTFSGYGFPPIRHNVRDMAIQPGALMDNIKTLPRVITLTTAIYEDTKLELHNDRRRLINLIKHDAVVCLEPFILRWNFYTDSDDEVADVMECHAFYDTGLQGRWQDKFHEEFAQRFIAYDPFWYRIGESAAHLDVNDAYTPSGIAGRIDGQWSTMGAIGTGDVLAIAIDGQYVYIGGDFLNWGDAQGDYIVQWDKVAQSYSSLFAAANECDGIVRALLVGPDGTLYIGGDFANIGGFPSQRCASWDGTIITNMSLGVAGTVEAFAIGMNWITGKYDGIYAGGNFQNVGADPNADHVIMWDSATSSWSAVRVPNARVRALAVSPDRQTLYLGGDFTQIGVTAGINYVGALDLTTAPPTEVALGSGMNGSVYALAVDDRGYLYAAGDFSTADGMSANGIAVWDGSAWSALGDGFDLGGTRHPYVLTFAPNGDLYIGGDSLYVGDLPFREPPGITPCTCLESAVRLVRWSENVYKYVDVIFPYLNSIEPYEAVYALAIDDYGLGWDLYVGLERDITTAGQAAGVTNVTNNGTATAYPTFHFVVTGLNQATSYCAVLATIRNETTDQELSFKLLFTDDDEVTVNLSTGMKAMFTDLRGNILADYRGTGLAEWGLRPGANMITVFISECWQLTFEAYMTWRDTFWSADDLAS